MSSTTSFTSPSGVRRNTPWMSSWRCKSSPTMPGITRPPAESVQYTRAVRSHDDVVWAVELLALVAGRDGDQRAVVLDAPDRALRPARDDQAALPIEGHPIGVARWMNERLPADARRPLVDRVADDVGPEKAMLAPVPDRTLTEIEPVRDLVERRIGAGDPFEPGRSQVYVHGLFSSVRPMGAAIAIIILPSRRSPSRPWSIRQDRA